MANRSLFELSVGRRTQDFVHEEEAKRYLVITNGVCTETDYFYWLDKNTFDSLEIVSRGNLSLDDMLDIAEKAKVGTAEKYDGIFIVLDIDDQLKAKKSRRNLSKFFLRAKALGVIVCLSNESFEIWLIAHKTTVSKEFGDRKIAAEHALKLGLLDPVNKKSIPEGVLQPQEIGKAIKEATRLRKLHKNILKRIQERM